MTPLQPHRMAHICVLYLLRNVSEYPTSYNFMQLGAAYHIYFYNKLLYGILLMMRTIQAIPFQFQCI